MNLIMRTIFFLSLLFYFSLFAEYKQESITTIKEQAQKGDAYYQGLLGFHLRKGDQLKKDFETACKWLKLSAEQQNPIGLYNLAVLYESGNFVKKDKNKAKELYQKAFKKMKKLADDKNVIAQTTLGLMFKYGDGTERDYKKAFKWLKKAAHQGYPEAQNYLAEMFQFGMGTPKSRFETIKWYKKAIKQKYIYAMHDLALFYFSEKKYKKAFPLYLKAAKLGYAPAQVKLAWMYNKALGVNQNIQEMFYWFSKAARQDEPSAQYNLAMIYYHGVGTAKDIKKAKYWLKKSAANNYKPAIKELKNNPQFK